jgi:hypothetical protein
LPLAPPFTDGPDCKPNWHGQQPAKRPSADRFIRVRSLVFTIAALAVTAFASIPLWLQDSTPDRPRTNSGHAPAQIGRLIGTYWHGDEVYSVAVGLLNGKSFAVSGGMGDSVRVWDLATGKIIEKIHTGVDPTFFCGSWAARWKTRSRHTW